MTNSSDYPSRGRSRSPSIERGKSYLERYQDIKNMTLNYTSYTGGSGRVGSSNAGSSIDESRVGSGCNELGGNARPPAFSSLSSFHRREVVPDPISLTTMDDESSATLERWENRKERKRAEDPEYASRAAGSGGGSFGGTGSRWSPGEGGDGRSGNDGGYSGTNASRWSPSTRYDDAPAASPEPNRRKEQLDCNNHEGDASPLFNDVELSPGREDRAGATPGSLGIDRHFQEERQRRDQQAAAGRKSNYADSLRSFSDAIGSAVAREYGQPALQTRARQSPPTATTWSRREDDVACTPRPDPAPSVSFYDGYNTTRGSSLGREPDMEEDQKYIGRRIRMGASGCCKRMSCRSSNYVHNDDDDGIWKPDKEEEYPSPRFASAIGASKRDRLHIYAALLICVGCVIATTITVKHFSSERGASFATAGGALTLRPTISSTPSSPPSDQPTGLPSTSPTNRPTSERERLLSEYLSEITDGASDAEGTPQHRAKMWILYDDGLHLTLPPYATPDLTKAVQERVKQRYALATLYYSLKVGEGGVLKGWLEGDECRFAGDYDLAWDGVDCDESGEVRALALDGANLSGSIPRQISLLHKMENIIIKNNPNLQGKIPNSIGELSQLRQLALYGNALTGTLPSSVLQLPELVYLNVADNALMGEIGWDCLASQKKLTRLILQNNFFEGSVPFNFLSGMKISLLGLSNNDFGGYVDGSVGRMANLEYLYLDRNKFAGRLPDSLGNLTNLVSLNLDENGFDGTLPSSIGGLSGLNYLSAKSNKLSGGLPASMQQLSNLKTLNLADNALSGNIRTLSEIQSLEHVHLYQNRFTGELPDSLFAIKNLKVLFLSSNSFSGNIPTGVSSARFLKGLYLSDNMFQGNIPNAACSLTNLEELFIDANAFSGQLPGCLGNLFKLKRFFAFKNQLTGNVPNSILNLPNLVELGLEENDISGGIDQACTANFDASLDIWADCSELQGGCDCCTKCCSDSHSQCS